MPKESSRAKPQIAGTVSAPLALKNRTHVPFRCAHVRGVTWWGGAESLPRVGAEAETQLSSTNSRERAGLYLPDCSGVSTSNALPILRTPDLLNAHQAVQRLLSLAFPMDKFQVGAEAQALTLEEAQRMVAAFPKAWVSPDDPCWPESDDEPASRVDREGVLRCDRFRDSLDRLGLLQLAGRSGTRPGDP